MNTTNKALYPLTPTRHESSEDIVAIQRSSTKDHEQGDTAFCNGHQHEEQSFESPLPTKYTLQSPPLVKRRNNWTSSSKQESSIFSLEDDDIEMNPKLLLPSLFDNNTVVENVIVDDHVTRTPLVHCSSSMLPYSINRNEAMTPELLLPTFGSSVDDDVDAKDYWIVPAQTGIPNMPSMTTTTTPVAAAAAAAAVAVAGSSQSSRSKQFAEDGKNKKRKRPFILSRRIRHRDNSQYIEDESNKRRSSAPIVLGSINSPFSAYLPQPRSSTTSSSSTSSSTCNYTTSISFSSIY